MKQKRDKRKFEQKRSNIDSSIEQCFFLLLCVPVYSARFLRKNDDVNAFRAFSRFAFDPKSFSPRSLLPVDDFLRRIFFDLVDKLDGVRATVDRLPLIIDIDDDILSSAPLFAAALCFDRAKIFAESMLVDSEYRLAVASRLALAN